MKLYILLLAVLLNINAVVVQENLVGKVVKVSDGDIFTLLLAPNKTARIRLYGIDAPETRQAYSVKSKENLSKMIAGVTVNVSVSDTDKYGCVIGKVSTPRCKDVNLEMLQVGLAWHYSHFDNTVAYREAEKEARKKKLGLWQDDSPINPYAFRKNKSRNR